VSDRLLDGRIDAVIQLLTRLAAGELAARGVPSRSDDDIDAVIVGVNMLAEELQASHEELEGRVRARTVELHNLNHDITRLTEIGNLLQACNDLDEAFAAMGAAFAGLFAGFAGVLYVYRASRNLLESRVSWGLPENSHPLLAQDCWALRRGQQHFVDATSPALSCRHIERRTGSSICIPLTAHGEVNGLLHLMDRSSEMTGGREGPTLTPAKQSLAMAVSEQAALAMANLELREKLRLQALRDPLTGLLNRRFIDEWMDREVARTDSSGRSFGVIMADIDHFKQINDLHGHEAGDQILKSVGETISGALRPSDLPCRYGGEEFLLLIADVDEPVLVARAQLVRNQVENLQVSHRGSMLPGITLSAGVALYPQHGATAAAVIAAADGALYAAKRSGRNAVREART